MIVTVSTNVMTSGGIEFMPSFRNAQTDAADKLALGSYDHIALELPDNPLGLESDDLVFEKSTDTHTAAILANVGGAVCIDRCRRRVRPRFVGAGRGRDDRLRARLAGVACSAPT